jgi:hypothetical protein
MLQGMVTGSRAPRRKRDFIRDFPQYVADCITLKPKLAEIRQLHDAGKTRQAAAQFKRLENSAAYKRVHRFETHYTTPNPPV